MAGAGYKLFNTGDVLTAAQVNTYLQEQVVMRFATTTARDTALSGVLAEGMICYIDADNNLYKYTGSAWVNVDSGSTSPLTTKGDLYTYSTTDARLAVGNNGETLVADSSTSVGLRYQEPKAQNPVINSSFQVWQRGTSLGGNANYTADRWYAGASAAGRTVSRQLTNDTTNLPNIQYCLRFQRDSGNTNTSLSRLINNFETIDSIPFAGKTVTLSFYARAGANFSPTSSIMKAYVVTGTGTDQNQDSGFTGQATPINQNATLTTTWQRFSYTGTIATTATQIAIRFDCTPVGTAGAADFFEVTGVMLEAASVATPYRSYSATLAGELAACQRYYERITSDVAYGYFGWGKAYGTATLQINAPFKVTKRVAPTALDTSAMSTFAFETGTTSGNTPTSLTLGTPNNTSIAYVEVTKTATFTNGAFYTLFANNSTTAYIGWSAEL